PSCTSSGSTPSSLVIRLLMEFWALKFQEIFRVFKGSKAMFLNGFWRLILTASSGSRRFTSSVSWFCEWRRLADILKGVPTKVLLYDTLDEKSDAVFCVKLVWFRILSL